MACEGLRAVSRSPSIAAPAPSRRPLLCRHALAGFLLGYIWLSDAQLTVTLSPGQSAMRERRETLRTLKERAATLCQAVDVLDAGLVASRAQVPALTGPFPAIKHAAGHGSS